MKTHRIQLNTLECTGTVEVTVRITTRVVGLLNAAPGDASLARQQAEDAVIAALDDYARQDERNATIDSE